MHSFLYKVLLFSSLIFCVKVAYSAIILEEEVINENTNTNMIVGGVSLITIGGAGSIVVAINNKHKKYNEPSDEIKKEDRKDL